MRRLFSFILCRPYLDNSTDDFVKAIQIVHQQLFEKHLNPKYACYITAACEIHRGNGSFQFFFSVCMVAS